jgi:ribosomal protein S18 acetylase RimI-like enzyme
VLVYNIGRFGMDEGGLPLNGHYFGRRDGSGLIAAGAVYNLGSLFFFAHGEQALEGLASYLLESGLRPWFTQGPRSQVELLLSEFADAGGPVPETMLSEYQVLRDRVAPGIDTAGTRPARPDELETLVEMGQEMQSELFQTEGMDEASMADLLGLQIEIGGAFVREVDGAVVAKAEATPAVPHAALVGGVYTLPEHRGRGHSTACVAALCSRMLERVGAVALSVEPENEAAFRAYRRIGFRKVTDWMVVTFTAGREAS